MMEDASPSERRLLLGGGPRDLPFLVVDLIRTHINRDTTLKSFVHSTFGSQFIAINCQDSLRGKVDELFPAIGAVLSLALTPLPMGYRTIFSTLLSVLVYTFPFALVSEITWETPIVSAFLAFGYYGVYSMSQELMLPFRPRTAASPDSLANRAPGLFSCNADWVRVMNDEFNRILVKKPALGEVAGVAGLRGVPASPDRAINDAVAKRDTAVLQDRSPQRLLPTRPRHARCPVHPPPVLPSALAPAGPASDPWWPLHTRSGC